MERCGECPECVKVFAARLKYPGMGTRNRKMKKKVEKKNKCVDPKPSAKRRKITGVENLRSAGRGGKIRQEVALPPSLTKLQMDSADRVARPVDLAEALFSNNAEHSKYLRIVLEYTKIAEESTSRDVWSEARSGIPTIKGLLAPNLRFEVDFTEATKKLQQHIVQVASQ